MARVPTNPGDEYIKTHKQELYNESLEISTLMTGLGKTLDNTIRSNDDIKAIINRIKNIYNKTDTFLRKHIAEQNSVIGNSTIQSFKNIISALRDIRQAFINNTNNNRIDYIKANFKNLSEPLLKGLRDFEGLNTEPHSAPAASAATPAPAPAPAPAASQTPTTNPTDICGNLIKIGDRVSCSFYETSSRREFTVDRFEKLKARINTNKIRKDFYMLYGKINPTDTTQISVRAGYCKIITDSPSNASPAPVSNSKLDTIPDIPFFARYNDKIIKVIGRDTDGKIQYLELIEENGANIWGEEQTRDIPNTELTPIICPPTKQEGGRRKTVRAKAKGKGKGMGKMRPTRRYRKRV
jgi:hypothetical protein